MKQCLKIPKYVTVNKWCRETSLIYILYNYFEPSRVKKKIDSSWSMIIGRDGIVIKRWSRTLASIMVRNDESKMRYNNCYKFIL